MQYELQFVKVEIEHTSVSVIHKAIRNKTSRKYYRKVYDTPQHNERQHVFDTPRHDEIKKTEMRKFRHNLGSMCFVHHSMMK